VHDRLWIARTTAKSALQWLAQVLQIAPQLVLHRMLVLNASQRDHRDRPLHVV